MNISFTENDVRGASGLAGRLPDRDGGVGYLLSALLAMSAVAVSMMVCSVGRGCQPSWVRALLLSTSLVRPNSGRSIGGKDMVEDSPDELAGAGFTY
ncbi:UNVERIFIED_ORG: hypothetical protein FHR35_006180 [Microbispora rosea subsp. rosea]